MAEHTYRSIADELGVTKPTVRSAAKEIDPDGEHVRMDGNKAVLDDWLASAVSAKIGNRHKDVQDGESEDEAAEQERGGTASAVPEPANRGTDGTLVGQLQAELEREREMIASLRADIEALRMENRQLWVYNADLIAAHWWNKRKVVMQWNKRLLPPSEDDEDAISS